MLTDEQIAEIVRMAIVRAGGFNEPHPDSQTLNQAGLKTGHQRESFQRKIARGVGEHRHKVPHVGKIPNNAASKVSDVKAFLRDPKNVVPLTEETTDLADKVVPS